MCLQNVLGVFICVETACMNKFFELQHIWNALIFIAEQKRVNVT